MASMASAGSARCASEASRWVSKAEDSTTPKAAIASRPAVRETALFTPEAVPASAGPTAFITVVVNGATVTAMPMPSTQTAGKKLVQ